MVTPISKRNGTRAYSLGGMVLRRLDRNNDRSLIGFCCGLLLLSTLFGCAGGSGEAEWPPRQKQWYDRAAASFRVLDIEDADKAIRGALQIDPNQKQVRVLAAQIALARLDFEAARKYVEGLADSEARGIRGRALWYAGHIEQAADELERLLADPEIRDPWAEQVVKLARRGSGREPFRITGGLLSVSEMPRIGSSALLVPVELDGEPALALIATGVPEVMIDSSGGREPSWISLRFGEQLEVKDVPALTQDLSGISRQLNAPVKLLLGTNLLRHLNATIDFFGSQFVVRSFTPPAPPAATTLKLHYVRGGGMVLRGRFGTDERAAAAAMIVDTSVDYPLALDSEGWKKAGVSLSTLSAVPGSKELRQGVVPKLALGAFELPEVPAVSGIELTKFESNLGIDLDGIVGSRMLAAFRVTLVDGGLTMWLEDAPPQAVGPEQDAPKGVLAPEGG
jgi:hypothetical protein